MLQKIGQIMVVIGVAIFLAMLNMESYQLNKADIALENEAHQTAVVTQLEKDGVFNHSYANTFAFLAQTKASLGSVQADLAKAYDALPEKPQDEWSVKLGDWKIKEYSNAWVKKAEQGPVKSNPWLFLGLTFGLCIIGGVLHVIPMFQEVPGIKNNGIYLSEMTRGLKVSIRSVFLTTTILGLLVYGYFYAGNNWFFPLITALLALGIIWKVSKTNPAEKNRDNRSASPVQTAWLGLITGTLLIGFYVLLYWAPAHITPWVSMVSPISEVLSGNEASQWFLYGLLYTTVVIVMGVRMIAKYRHNNYQMIRTGSVMFFQTAIAFLLPEILVRLNQPYYDFKNIWPLNYSFFFDWNLDNLLNSGGLGLFMLVWGIVLIVIGVPVFTYFFGKRWYCSWVCGCGGLAETLGDPYRQLSDKSLSAWQYERYIIHGVLVFAVVMTGMVLTSYFTGIQQFGFVSSDGVRTWYGFFIGAGFSGVVGTGFYPLMGNRVWCRFGCPLAAYLGLVQRFKSKFRITVNGSQCISCGNCSTYCEMGIDVRSYAQQGQDIVRSSCVGCGVCAAVCPRGVLRLENASEDIGTRASEKRTVHVREEDLIFFGK